MTDENSLREISAIAMRCGGCGAKVGSTVLSRVINRLQPITGGDIIIGLNEPGKLRDHKHFPLLFDPQTSGGLLASIPAENAEVCLAELLQLGYPASVFIGKVTDDTESLESVSLIAG